MNTSYRLSLALVSTALAVTACDHNRQSQTAAPDTKAEENIPHADKAWTRVDGTVVTAGPSSFELDYGDGLITVEMDDFDFYAEGRHLMVDDDVIVYGRVDNGLFEERKIEAGSVYVKNLGTYFQASSIDEEDLPIAVYDTAITPGSIYLEGEVKKIQGREFWLDTGAGVIEVDTVSLGYNPLDDEGFHQVDEGDEVRVHGKFDKDLFDNLELAATSIVSVSG